jgi:hypothetical protein
MVGFRALRASEPRQVRKEAALRIPSQVTRFRLTGAGDASAPRGSGSKPERATGHDPAGLASGGTGIVTASPNRRSFMSLLTIIIIVVVVLLVAGFFGRGRFRA